MLRGITIDHFSLNGAKVEKLYLKWDNALLIKAKKINLNEWKSDESSTLASIKKLPKNLKRFQHWVKKLQIDELNYHNINGSFVYNENGSGEFKINSDHYDSHWRFNLTPERFSFHLDPTSIKDFTFYGDGTITFRNEMVQSKIYLQPKKMPLIKLSLIGNKNRLKLFTKVTAPVTTLKPIYDFVNIDSETRPWIDQRIQYSTIVIPNFELDFNTSEEKNLLDALDIKFEVNNVAYRFNDLLSPIKSNNVKVHFKDKQFFINPQNPYYEDLSLNHSHLVIDLRKSDNLMDLMLKSTNARLDSSLHKLLNAYDIHIPIKQSKGDCDVDLLLHVNLTKETVTSEGKFLPKNALISFKGIPLHLNGGAVGLKNNIINIDNVKAMEDNSQLTASVNGIYNINKEVGKIQISSIEIPDSKFSSNVKVDPNHKLTAIYEITPLKNLIHIPKSYWLFNNERLAINEVNFEFKSNNHLLAIKNIPFNFANKIMGHLQLHYDQNHVENNFIGIDINHFNMHNTQLKQSSLNVALYPGKAGLIIKTLTPSKWVVNKNAVQLSDFEAYYNNGLIEVKKSVKIMINELLDSTVKGNYNLFSHKGIFQFSNLDPINPRLAALLDKQQNFDLNVDLSSSDAHAAIPSLKTRFQTSNNGWKIMFDDINLFSKHSQLLQKYHINNGHLNVYYTGTGEHYNFDGTVNYPYSLLIDGKSGVNNYSFKGTLDENQVSLTINDRVVIQSNPSNVNVLVKNTGINTPELVRFLESNKNILSSESTNNSKKKIVIRGENTFFNFIKDRRIVSDSFDANIVDNSIEANLKHANGAARIKVKDNNFVLTGSGFNDQFMKKVFLTSDFKGGNCSFDAEGDFKNFSGIIKINNTILKEYKLLNNILAFVNTIPSLATFSLPNYHSQGLPVSEAYAVFHHKNEDIIVDDFILISPELKMKGQGNGNLHTNTIDGKLTLKTDLGSTFSKVPVVGYILLGDDKSIATTLNISGKLDDPKLDTELTKELFKAPINIIKRTLTYPFYWMQEYVTRPNKPAATDK